MELVQKEEISLGLESYDALGFNSQEELELEISKLIKTRPKYFFIPFLALYLVFASLNFDRYQRKLPVL